MTYPAKKSNAIVALVLLLSTNFSYSWQLPFSLTGANDSHFPALSWKPGCTLAVSAMSLVTGMRYIRDKVDKWKKSKSTGEHLLLKKAAKEVLPTLVNFQEMCIAAPYIVSWISYLKYNAFPIPNYLNELLRGGTVQCNSCNNDITHSIRCPQCFPSQIS